MFYPMIFIPIIVGLTAQTIKFILIARRRKKLKWSYIFEHGYMPSAHTAFVTSFIATVGCYEGFSSSAFAISFILAYIVIDDALRFRRDLGRHGQFLNFLVKKFPELDHKKYPHLKERLGHKVSEVIVGGFIGVGLSLLLIQFF